MIESYRDLHIWQKGMDLAEMTYKLARDFPGGVVSVCEYPGVERHRNMPLTSIDELDSLIQE